jgi:hypothetical protein
VPDHLVAAHGGTLIDLYADAERAADLRSTPGTGRRGI